MASFHPSLLSLSQQCFFTALNPTACHTQAQHFPASFGCALAPLKTRASSKSVHCGSPILSRRCRSSKTSATSGAGMEQGEEQDVDLSELSDAELDALFDEYGEVVRSDADRSSPTLEIDEDAESLAFAVASAEAANEVKAADIKVLHVKPLVYWTKFFVIATAFSRPQVDAMGKRIRDMAEERFEKVPAGDLKPNSWTLLDFGDVVVHIFLPKERAFYNLEEFYGNASVIDLPFLSQARQ